MKCRLCQAAGARWTQFPQGHCLACDDCAKRDGGWRRGEGPVSCAMPEEGAAPAPRLQSCFRRTAAGALCHLPKGHDGDCIYQ